MQDNIHIIRNIQKSLYKAVIEGTTKI